MRPNDISEIDVVVIHQLERAKALRIRGLGRQNNRPFRQIGESLFVERVIVHSHDDVFTGFRDDRLLARHPLVRVFAGSPPVYCIM